MKIRKFLCGVVVTLCVGGYLLSSVSVDDERKFSVEVDLSEPMYIEWPFEVAIAGDSGEKALRIGANVGRGWKGEAGGKAEYKFYIPEDGMYYLWFYSLWFDGCANAVFGQIDGNEKIIIGNDPVYNQWHWGRGVEVFLSQGSHRMVLSNHSDHVAVEKIVFMNSDVMKPGEDSVVFSDIFYDGFDGCDQGNFSLWQEVCGDWMVTNPVDQQNYAENVLLGKSNDRAFIIYEGDFDGEYSLNIRVKADLSEGGKTGICFGVQDKDNYYKAEFNREHIRVIRKVNGDEHLIGGAARKWEDNIWVRVEIRIGGGDIVVEVDDVEAVSVGMAEEVAGGIALMLNGEMEGQFDDIHVRAISNSDDGNS